MNNINFSIYDLCHKVPAHKFQNLYIKKTKIKRNEGNGINEKSFNWRSMALCK